MAQENVIRSMSGQSAGSLPSEAASDNAALTGRRTLSMLLILLAVLYVPVVADVSRGWNSDGTFAFGCYIIPVAVFLVWMRRDEVRHARYAPDAIGFIPLALGVAVLLFAYLVRIKYLAFWSLVPSLAGVVLLAYGRDLYRKVRFPIIYMLLAQSVPTDIIGPPSRALQAASTVCATEMMRFLGFTVTHAGNFIDVPGMTLEVADICSGANKFVTLLAFALVYCYVRRLPATATCLLLLIPMPLALACNVLRLNVLIATAQSAPALFQRVHDAADIVANIVAVLAFLWIGSPFKCPANQDYRGAQA
jgi:exosortase